jgi:hypothetical protein
LNSLEFKAVIKAREVAMREYEERWNNCANLRLKRAAKSVTAVLMPKDALDTQTSVRLETSKRVGPVSHSV